MARHQFLRSFLKKPSLKQMKLKWVQNKLLFDKYWILWKFRLTSLWSKVYCFKSQKQNLQHPHNYFNLHVCPSLRRPSASVGVRRPGVPLPSFQFLQAYDKVSLIKVAWYVFRVKNIHSWSPPDPLSPWDEEKASYIHYNIRREGAKLRILKLASVFHHLPSVGPKQLCALAHLGCTREAGTS